MPEPVHNVEVLPRLGAGGRNPASPLPRRPRRLAVFLVTFILCLTLGLYYDFQRPPVYRSNASLLTVAPPEVDQRGEEADIQHVTIQRQRLLSKPLLDEVVNRLEAEFPEAEFPGLSVYQLQPMLSVAPVPETNLVELRAEGPDAAFLPRLVNSWLSSYLEERAEEVRRASAETTDSLREQYDGLGIKIVQKRDELDQFRQENEILSMGRDENQVLARLKGLNKSLNDASEAEVKAKARLDAIQAAIEQGEAVVPDQDKRTLAQMEKRAQEMRERLAELDRRYKRSYFQLDAEMQVLPEQLEKLEKKIRQEHESGRDIVTTSAQQEYAAARQSVRELRRQLEDHKQKATEFTARFAEHEALQEDLARLEELYRGTEERLVQIEVKNRQKYPQVKVVEWAFQPSEPIRPLYLRDAGIVLAASILVALFMVWLVDFLTPKSEEEPPVTLTGVAIYPQQGVPAIEQGVTRSQIESSPAPVLESPQMRELSLAEVEALFAGADLATRQLLALLLSGLSAEELLLIEDGDVDPGTGEVRVQGSSARTIQLPALIIELFKRSEGELLIWKREKGAPDPEELDARLELAAVDAGLADSEQVNCQLVRHTYIAYLVRQGVRLSELEKVAGRMMPKVLAGYGRISPAGPGRPLEEISVFYPYPG